MGEAGRARFTEDLAMSIPAKRMRARPFREALRMEVLAAGDDFKKLRTVARALLDKAATGDVSAIREVADRLDGKVTQGVINEDDTPLKVTFAWKSNS
jgi:hypothetical protein